MTKEEKDGILSVILDIPTPLKRVKLAPKNRIEQLLIFLKIKGYSYRMLYLSGLKLSTNYRLTAISNGMILKSAKAGDMDKFMDIYHQNIYQMAGYIAAAVHNKNEETPRYLIQSIADEFTNEELKLAVKDIYRRLDVQSFFDSTALVRSLSLM
ncbi:hypothetical protein HDE69_002661 [Pedobacter cryoconitis]|uniref:Uncharacterized protein n=1 Tax=Pedobacter cryoconitis TaxID=188932 RepID=A0A7W8YU72_9SPHI|nr:hypothetical protein [Pedobacter cryoconitis]MBB5621600.1 hypothetical protein [Pedobacter cryoconitis]